GTGSIGFAREKQPDFAVDPFKVRILIDDDARWDGYGQLMQNELLGDEDDSDEIRTTSALVIDFDPKQLQPRTSPEEIRGIPRTKHSMVFGFTTNLEPHPRGHVRLDSLESSHRNQDVPFSEYFFVKKLTKVAPATKGYSRSYDYW